MRKDRIIFLKEHYKNEIEIAIYQNGYVEMELNSIIVCLLRELCPNLSFRDVTSRRKTKISEKFISKAGFPDFVITNRTSDSTIIKYGAIELKGISKHITFNDKQFIGHKKSYDNVIYTNGLKWIFGSKEKEEEFLIGFNDKGKITIYEEKWIELIDYVERVFLRNIK